LLSAVVPTVAQPRVERVAVGSKIIETSVWGSGEPVLLLPGLGWSASAFELLGPALASAGYHAIAMNPRGIRGSTGRLQNLTLHDYANDVAELVTAQKLGRVHVLGWAFGNRVARVTANDHPDMVASVILLAAGGRVAPDPEAQLALNALVDPLVPKDRVAELAKLVLFGPEATNLARFLALHDEWPEAQAAESAAARASPFEEWWAGGSSTMLVVQGLNDRSAPVGNGRALKKEFPNRVELVELPRLGHAALFEAPDVVAAAVVRFLKAPRVRVDFALASVP